MRGELGLLVGYLGFGQNSGLGNASYRYDVPAPAVGVGLRGGLKLNTNLGFEVAARYSSTSFRDPAEFNQPKAEPNIAAYNEGGSATIIGLRALARWDFPLKTDTLTPFVIAGGGIDMVSSDKSYEQDGESYKAILDGDSDWAFQVGGGASIKLTHRWSLRLDAAYFLSEPAPERQYIKGGGGVVSNFEVLAAVSVSLGGPAGDSDNDGMADDKDKCPDKAEDKDGFEDADGCPEVDNDKDGVLDKEDKCPNKAEDKDGFKDYDGCPELDNDNDGIADTKDRCPNKKEDIDKFQDGDGCPDLDNDKDGIPDTKDKCRNQAEDPDGFQDHDGCPDPDDDKDGVLDKVDKCPKKAESRNGYQDEDGCPDVMPKEILGLTSKPVYGISFKKKTGAVNVRRSKTALEPIVTVLAAHTVFNVEIKCHVDLKPVRKRRRKRRRKKAAADPQQISADRCSALKSWFESKGINSRRLRTKAMGNTKPIAEEGDKKGYKKNTRFEFGLW